MNPPKLTVDVVTHEPFPDPEPVGIPPSQLAFDGPKPTQLVSEPSGALRPAMAGSHPPVALGIKTEPLKDEPGG